MNAENRRMRDESDLNRMFDALPLGYEVTHTIATALIDAYSRIDKEALPLTAVLPTKR